MYVSLGESAKRTVFVVVFDEMNYDEALRGSLSKDLFDLIPVASHN